jgi:hypothetical protein
MTIALQPIYTQTVGSGGVASITFNNIPQTFTDLKLEVSARGSQSGGGVADISILFNNDGSSVYSYTGMSGNNNGTDSFRLSNVTYIQFAFFGTGNDATANTFGSTSVYIPNYTSASFKSGTGDTVTENNSSTAYWMRLMAYLYRSTSPITSIRLTPTGTSLLQNSTFTLYGITKG